MALAASLIKGFKYEVAQGILAGEVVTIVDNTTFPDGHENARKITVKFSDGGIDYVLPRLISDVPVGIENPALVSVDPPVPAVHAAPVALDLADEPIEVEVAPGVQAQFRTLRPITDPMDARLDHLRPSKAKVRKYIKRVMANGMSDVDFLLTFTTDVHRADNELRPANIMLKGDTQSGKTFMVEVLAVMWSERMGLPKPMPIFTLSGSAGVTDFDLFGQTTSYTDPNTGQESLVWLPGVVDMAAQCGGILYLDEVNAMAERVTSSLHPLSDHRHQFINRNKPVYRHGQFMPEVVMGHQDLWIIGTYNEGYAGMGKMNEAFQNRFRHIRWDYDEAVEAKLVDSPTVLFLGKALREARKANSRGVRTPVGTAALIRLARDVDSFGVELALEVFVGMFQPGETDVVEAIIEDRSVIMLLNEEVEQRAREAAPAFEVVGGSDDAQALLNMLGN